MKRIIFTTTLILAFGAVIHAQDEPANRLRQAETYLLGPDDQITVRVVDADETSDKPMRIGPTGDITLPMIGAVHAAGLTVEQLEKEIAVKLKKYYKAPEVFVTRTEMRPQPVSVIGAVQSPGVHQLQGRKTLVEILSLAGGVREDAAGYVRITRRLEWGRIPLPNAADDETALFSIADVPVKDLIESKNPEWNIAVMPNDVISVPKKAIAKTDTVYVIGDVGKAGGIPLNADQKVTVLQAVSMASGLMKTAKAKEARILRLNPASAKRDEISVDLTALLAGKIDDVAMLPEDILFVPSANRNVTTRALESALQIGTGVAILSIRP